MLYKKTSARIKNITPSSVVYEYLNHSQNLGLATSEINGALPESGLMINKVCDEIYYVIEGYGEITYKDVKYKLEKGDVFFIDKNTPFCVNGNSLKLFIVTTPAFFQEQWENIK